MGLARKTLRLVGLWMVGVLMCEEEYLPRLWDQLGLQAANSDERKEGEWLETFPIYRPFHRRRQSQPRLYLTRENIDKQGYTMEITITFVEILLSKALSSCLH